MTTPFSSLPIVDVGALKNPTLDPKDASELSNRLYNVFSTTGFAYLVNVPLSFDHDEVFSLTREFFALPLDQRMRLAKKSFRPAHRNTYRGYFPAQPHLASDNLKEGFEIGNPTASQDAPSASPQKIDLSEPNVWPDTDSFNSRTRLEELYTQLQALSSQLLSLLAVALGKQPTFFTSWLNNSVSTLRLLHYPPVPQAPAPTHADKNAAVKLSCTPHTDSGILTLLHQDATGGLEVLNAAGDWVPAPYIPGSVVVNIGDLMATVSGGRFTATMHRVRAPSVQTPNEGFGRFSVPFFFEPGEKCVVEPIDGSQEGVVYGEHVRKKMLTWVEFQDDSGYDTGSTEEL